MRLRPATADDADAIGALHADSWRRSYRGALRDEYLDGDIVPERTALWRARLGRDGDVDASTRTTTILALADDRGSDVVGFAHASAGGEDDAEWGPLLDNLHVADAAKRQGVGTALLRATATWARDVAGATRLHLWVLDANTGARRFYETLGAVDAGGDVWHAPGGGTAPRRRYAWRDLAPLLDR